MLLNVKQRITLKETIPFAGIMSALSLLTMGLAKYLGVFGYVMLLFLPLIATLYALKSPRKYYWLFLVTTNVLGALICWAINNFSYVFCYMLPSTIMGFVFSLCIDRDENFHIIFILGSIILFVIQAASIPLVNLINEALGGESNFVNTVLNAFGFNSKRTLMTTLIYSFIYVTCCAEVLLVYLLLKSELPKFGYVVNNKQLNFYLAIFTIFVYVLTFVFFFVGLYQYMNACITIGFVCSIFLTIELVTNKIVPSYYVAGGSFVLSWILFVIIYQISNRDLSLATLGFVVIPLALSSTVIIIFFKKQKRKINTK